MENEKLFGTPLIKVGSLSQDLVFKLKKALWIETVEELFELMENYQIENILNHLGIDNTSNLKSNIFAFLNKNNPSFLKLAPSTKFGLGYLPPREKWETLSKYAESLSLEDYLSETTTKARLPLSEKLPSEFSLLDKFGPVRDQGSRGTCVAFASVALREYFSSPEIDLSEQFFYWACKQVDGFPNEAGTTLVAAQEAFKIYGVCLESTWPYNPEPLPDDETQGEPSEEAKEEAKKYMLSESESLLTNSVERYKQILAGLDGKPARPVVIGTLVFNSWYLSRITHLTGKIIMPLPGEKPLLGGHAWLIIGYKDDPSVPGGGYFILRNSWGPNWAPQSPIAPGYAMAPYAYVEKFTIEAYTGLPKEQNTYVIQGNLAKYIEELDRPMLDLDGNTLNKGDKIIKDPVNNKFREYTTDNLKKFIKQGYSWDEESKRQYWRVSKNKIKDMESNLTAKNEFFKIIEENLSFVSSRIKYFKANKKDLTNQKLFKEIYSKIFTLENLIHENLKAEKVNGEYLKPEINLNEIDGLESIIREGNELRFYEVQISNNKFLVIAVFFTVFSLNTPGELTIATNEMKKKNVIIQIVNKFSGLTKKYKVIFTIGTLYNCPTDINANLICSSKGAESWKINCSYTTSDVFEKFLVDLVVPEPIENKKRKILKYLDEKKNYGLYSITANDIWNEFKFSEKLIDIILQEAQKEGKIYLEKDKHVTWVNLSLDDVAKKVGYDARLSEFAKKYWLEISLDLLFIVVITVIEQEFTSNSLLYGILFAIFSHFLFKKIRGDK